MTALNDQLFARTEFYSECADRLLAHKDDRTELVTFVRGACRAVGHRYLDNTPNPDGTKGVQDICPFTVMGAFNRGGTVANRKTIASEIGRFLGVEHSVPESFEGIPTLNAMKSVVFWGPQIELGWEIFETSLQLASSESGNLRERFIELYDRALSFDGINVNLSMGLFWTRPHQFPTLDNNSRKYIVDCANVPLPTVPPSGQEYLDLASRLRVRFREPDFPVSSFPELAAVAYGGPPPPPPCGYTIANILVDGCFLPQITLEKMLHRLRTKQNIILQGPPGAGKTWLSRRLAYALIGRKDDDKVRQVQFHPNLSYEDFVRGWRPQGDGKLELVDGPFLKLAEDARQDDGSKYVMVIEEINRGNPASIFGELLTLLEPDKRSPNDALALAYPRDDSERFHIPPNVYVIGTMNLADRSLALVDFALRRRFAFFDLEPQLNDAWREWVQEECGIPDDFLADIAARIGALNDQIAADRNLGPQFRIGHSHVTPPPDTSIDDPQQWFTEIVETEIAPLLREYWFDYVEKADAATMELLNGL